MKKHLKKVSFFGVVLIFTSLLALGCSAQNTTGTIPQEKTITVCENVSQIQDDTPPLNIAAKNMIDLPEGVKRIYGFMDNDTIVVLLKKDNESFSKLYLYNIITKSLLPLNSVDTGEENLQSISEDGKKLLYKAGESLYVYDLENKKHKKIRTVNELEDTGAFADYEGQYILSVDFSNGGFKLEDTKTGSIKTLKLGTNSMIEDNLVSIENDNNIYLSGTFDGKSGIFKIDITKMEKIETVLELPDKDRTIAQFDFLEDGKTLIFTGVYDNEPGIFIYDTSKDSIVKIVSGRIDKEEGPGVPFYNLASDKKTILFETLDSKRGYTNIYAAQINNNVLTSKKRLYKETQTYGAIFLTSWWTPDSKTVLIDQKKWNPSEEERSFEIKRFEILD